uniref:Secreted protein n=1 Tax=Globodera pallida TaxID=36090 RepID=A0A183C7M0_GLOPA
MHFVVVVVTAVLLSMFSTSTFVHCGGGDVSSDSSEYHSPEAENPSERRPVKSSTATPSTSGGGASDRGQRKFSFKAFAERVQKTRNTVVNGASRGARVVSTGVSKHVVPTVKTVAGKVAGTVVPTVSTKVAGTIVPTVTTAAGKVAGTIVPTVTTAAGKVAGTIVPTVTTAAGKVAGTAQRGATEVRNAVEPRVEKGVWTAREKAVKPVYNNVVVPVAQFVAMHAGRVTEWPLEKEPEQGKAKKEEE